MCSNNSNLAEFSLSPPPPPECIEFRVESVVAEELSGVAGFADGGGYSEFFKETFEVRIHGVFKKVRKESAHGISCEERGVCAESTRLQMGSISSRVRITKGAQDFQ